MRHHLTVYHTLIKDGFKLYNFYRLDGTPFWKLSETCQASGFTIVLNGGIHQTPTQTHFCGWVLNGSVARAQPLDVLSKLRIQHKVRDTIPQHLASFLLDLLDFFAGNDWKQQMFSSNSTLISLQAST
jgi:hypothetical protein